MRVSFLFSLSCALLSCLLAPSSKSEAAAISVPLRAVVLEVGQRRHLPLRDLASVELQGSDVCRVERDPLSGELSLLALRPGKATLRVESARSPESRPVAIEVRPRKSKKTNRKGSEKPPAKAVGPALLLPGWEPMAPP